MLSALTQEGGGRVRLCILKLFRPNNPIITLSKFTQTFGGVFIALVIKASTEMLLLLLDIPGCRNNQCKRFLFLFGSERISTKHRRPGAFLKIVGWESVKTRTRRRTCRLAEPSNHRSGAGNSVGVSHALF